MNCIHHQLQRWIYDGPRLLGIEVLDQLHRAFDVGEQRSDRLALTLNSFSYRDFTYSDWRII
jgi:hypothetical protein